MSDNAPNTPATAEGDQSSGTTPQDPVEAEAAATSARDADSAGEKENTEQKELSADKRSVEIGGRDGLDPVRYGDWEKGGRCIDF